MTHALNSNSDGLVFAVRPSSFMRLHFSNGCESAEISALSVLPSLVGIFALLLLKPDWLLG